MIPSSHLILCRPPLLLAPIFPSIRVFSSKSVLHIRWPKYWSFSFSSSPSNEYSGLISLRIDWFDLSLSKGLWRVISSTTVQKHKFFSTPPPLWSSSHIMHDYWSGLPFPLPGDLSDLGIKLTSLMSPAMQVGSLALAPPGKPRYSNSTLGCIPRKTESCILKRLFAHPHS